MRDQTNAQAFVLGEIEALEAFEFLIVGPAQNPLNRIEVACGEDRSLSVQVPGRPPILPELAHEVQKALLQHGFASENATDRTKPWSASAKDPQAAVELVQTLLRDVFGEKPDAALDIVHGSRVAEHEAQVKLAGVRERVEAVLTELMGKMPDQDVDADYLLPIGDVRVVVAPRALPGGPAIVRVFAVTNVGVPIAPELGLFLARLNFGLMFGRFALDAEHNAIWFDETLLGDQLNEDALRFAIRIVSTTADEWDDRLKQMFGGMKYQEVLKGRGESEPLPVKPGEPTGREGLGLYL